MATRTPLVLLLIFAFSFGFFNMTTTGDLRIDQPWKSIEQLIIVGLVYWWYYADKIQRQYHTSIWLNIGIVALSLIAIPIYLFRSRSAKQRFKSLGLFFVFFVLLIAVLSLGGVSAKQLSTLTLPSSGTR